MTFADAMTKESMFTTTENGAVALNNTGNSLLNLYGVVGALRGTNDDLRLARLIEKAYDEDPLFMTKILFYARDCHGYGLGERETFRRAMEYLADNHPECVLPNIKYFGEFGRFDDLFALIGTAIEDSMWSYISEKLHEDYSHMLKGEPVSLLAKWLKTPDASSRRTRAMGIYAAQQLGMSVYLYKRALRKLRKYIKVTECYMSTNNWDEINYSSVPSKAMLNYRNAFKRHDEERYSQFVQDALEGKVTIHSGTLYPYDLIEKVWDWNYPKEDDVVEAQWRQLPNYVEDGVNALIMADTSGSMDGRPIATAVGLAIYFAERNTGAYHNLWMSFSGAPRIHKLRGKTLAQKLSNIDRRDWQMNTNLEAAFQKVLQIAIDNNVDPKVMPKALIVISDMEIDRCTQGSSNTWSFYEEMESRFNELGYDIPCVIFWNVDSRHDVFHADAKRKGVQLVSGQSTTTFKHVIDCIGMTPIEAMYKTVDCDRYSCITVGEKNENNIS